MPFSLIAVNLPWFPHPLSVGAFTLLAKKSTVISAFECRCSVFFCAFLEFLRCSATHMHCTTAGKARFYLSELCLYSECYTAQTQFACGR